VCADLPEVEEHAGGEHGRHIAFTVRKRTFGYFTDDHHGDGRLALIVKVPPGEQNALIRADAEYYFMPPYLGHRGWVGFRLDVGTVDWDEARELLVESYCLCTP
jgi:predicted DNA-binding protein (MmcQ/YjbR family)